MLNRLVFILLLSISPGISAGNDIVVEYDLLNEAIENEIAGIDFSDMAGVNNCDICGRSVVGPDVMTDFVRRFNRDFDSEIAERYIELGEIYGLRGDIAFCQAILETGWFRFDRGTAVTVDQHNYCGLGVVKKGLKGARFDTVRDGVAAHLQHLYAYATTEALPVGEMLVDPRFKAVRRGTAVQWSDLNNHWAMSDLYGSKILKIYSDLLGYKVSRSH